MPSITSILQCDQIQGSIKTHIQELTIFLYGISNSILYGMYEYFRTYRINLTNLITNVQLT